MAQRALVDTTVLYAAGNQAETKRHQAALQIVRGTDHGELPVLVITDVVLVETMNGLHRDVGNTTARGMLRRLQEGVNFLLVREPHAVWTSGLELFRRYERLSLADSVQLAAARHHGIEVIYSFDGGFDGIEDLTRLTTPEDPFAP